MLTHTRSRLSVCGQQLASPWSLSKGQSSASFLSSIAVAAWALQLTPRAQGGQVLVSGDPLDRESDQGVDVSPTGWRPSPRLLCQLEYVGREPDCFRKILNYIVW